ncbi:hypothetical protein Apa02nite_014210 [Actinoplanes palleronii]|uniref:Uncharacterized protein n=1 Tax=Actinoplanes palleronii TaxID=113570 RepID=A0ABQ4B3S6_9ACTN|nr:hypothetical protein Apa02nite_014210 [Actinoplanes palleronii]
MGTASRGSGPRRTLKIAAGSRGCLRGPEAPLGASRLPRHEGTRMGYFRFVRFRGDRAPAAGTRPPLAEMRDGSALGTMERSCRARFVTWWTAARLIHWSG